MPRTNNNNTNKNKKQESKYFNIEDSSEEDERLSSSKTASYKFSQFSFSKKKLGIQSESSSNDDDSDDQDSAELSNGDLNDNFSDSEDNDLGDDIEDEDDEMTTTSSKKSKTLSKKEQTKLKLEMDEFFKPQEVEYSFDVSTTSKREQLKLTSKDLRINSASCRDDFDSISTLSTPSRASQNSDIILKLEICDVETNYKGNIKFDFPTVSQLNNYVGYQGARHISYQKTNKKEKGKVLIDRTLDDGQKSFLQSYPGNTTENFDQLCKTTPNNKIISVGLRPPSCIMYYFENAKDVSDVAKKNLYNVHIKRGTDVFEMPVKLYNHLKTKAIDNLEKNFSYSDISSRKFHIVISPLMSSTTQNALDKKIKRLENEKKPENQQFIEVLKKKGFSNFYNTNPQSNHNLQAQIEAFESTPQKYTFKGKLRITYFQVKNPSPVKNKVNK